MSDYVRYIEKTREYYKSMGYEQSYRWAHFDEVPFTPLTKPLASSRIALISTSDISVRGIEVDSDETQMGNVGGMYSIDSDVDIELLYSPSVGYDIHATTLEDVNAYFPISRLREAVAAGRIGSLARRFHGVYNAYSQRRTRERDAVEVLQRCREDGVDVAVLVPVCPVCHQTISLVSRHLEANGIPTVVIGTARDIVEHCGVARFLHTDFPLGNPCGEPWLADQQQAILEHAFRLLESATKPRTTELTPYQWRAGDEWKARVFTPEQPFHTAESRENWLRKKELYRQLKAEGKV